jgi:hypothetical protein
MRVSKTVLEADGGSLGVMMERGLGSEEEELKPKGEGQEGQGEGEGEPQLKVVLQVQGALGVPPGSRAATPALASSPTLPASSGDDDAEEEEEEEEGKIKREETA